MKTISGVQTVTPYPRNRLLMVDGGKLAKKKHTIHGLFEFDMTAARETLASIRSQTGETISFSAFFLVCLGKAIEQHKECHAYRNWRNQLVIFEDVDVNMLFEVDVDGIKSIRPHILRGVNKKTALEIHREILAFQNGHAESREANFINWFVRLPGVIRRLALRFMLMNPQMVKDYYGTVLVSSVGMFGRGSGWGIPVPNHSLQITLGGIVEKPGIINHQVEVRNYMSVTVSFDHDVIDGAPMARFVNQLKKVVENSSR